MASGGQKGRVGSHQIVSTYGVGSIYELRTHVSARSALHSVMMAGLDFWPSDQHQMESISEPYLQQILGVQYFLVPPTESATRDTSLPSVRFPTWLVCNRCSTLGRAGREFNHLSLGGPKCLEPGCRGTGVPARLVAACCPWDDGDDDTQPGHIEDFPWEWWAHSESGTGHVCESPRLKLEGEGKTASLAGLVVRCHSNECQGKVGRSLEGVFGEFALAKLRCSGSRPWLRDSEYGCDRRLRAMLRGASNVYFPARASAISIPPTSSRLSQILQSPAAAAVIGSVGRLSMSDLIAMVRLLRGTASYSDEQIEQALNLHSETGLSDAPRTEGELRMLERRALIIGRSEKDDPQGEFIAAPVPETSLQRTRHLFSNLVQAHRLREVRALHGFRRVTDSSGPVAPLSTRPLGWLPAVEVRGEGVFFELSGTAVNAWLASDARGTIRQRVEPLHHALAKLGRFGSPGLPHVDALARFVLVHTLSHLLMTQFALQSGYSSTALRERLYVGERVADPEPLGCLIYTATSGSDGTLGGLVRHGLPDRFERSLIDALRNSLWCSSDPLCIESGGQGVDGLNLAACHACVLVPETACEMRNTLLDRGLLIGTPGRPEAGFFYSLLRDS